MDYSGLDECLQALFYERLALSQAQSERLGQACSGVLLAESNELRQIGKWVKRDGQLAYREQWVRRLLDARFVSAERVYQPLVKQAFAGQQARPWHLIIDRSTLDGKQKDWLVVSRAYRKRALPLVWSCIPCGGSAV